MDNKWGLKLGGETMETHARKNFFKQLSQDMQEPKSPN